MNRPLLLAVLTGALIAAPQALANVELTATCTQANAHLFNWPAGPLVIDDLTVTVGGAPVRTGPYAFTGPAASVTVPLAVHGQAVIDVTATHAGRSYSVSQPVSCPVSVVEPPVAEIQPAPVVPVAVPPRVVPPMPVKARTPLRPRRVTCSWLLSVGAGPRWYTARGFYYRCVVPRSVVVRRPPVAG